MTATKSLLSLLLWICFATAQNTTSYQDDPYLAYRPAFARSLPVQILLTGVVLTLVAVLFIHLVFTGQYHWPLAPVNYVLQLSGVTTLLISLIATLHVVLSAAIDESRKWPYMLSYIAVNVPPKEVDAQDREWTVAERATWLIMSATTSGVIQITHIQFLTLLYPSRLEGQLIFSLLGPLAVVAAVMQLLPIIDSSSVAFLATAVRNVCNAALSLLFTVALFVWGLLVNRGQAWRTDGGTAAFGCAALLLAVCSTGLNFLYVDREEEYVWLPPLMWAVVLWQSFLGWWWWVGAGSGSGLASEDDEMIDRVRREEKREARRKQVREKRQQNKKRVAQMWSDVTGALRTRRPTQSGSRSPSPGRAQDDTADEPSSPHSESSPVDQTLPHSNSTYSLSSSSTSGTLPRFLPNVVHQWYASLRHAHMTAARRQAQERVERIRELERSSRAHAQGRESGRGWGLGSFGLRTNNYEVRRPSKRRRPRTPPVLSVPSVSSRDVAMSSSVSPHEGTPQSNSSTTMVPPESSETYELRVMQPTSDSSTSLEQNTPTSVRPRSVWFWGPLARWRLKDSTVY